MSLCDTCSSAIVKLRPQAKDSTSSGNYVQATLPKLEAPIIRNCWICAKFSKWLAAEHLELFRIWQKEKVPVNYSVYASIVSPQPRCRRLMGFSMNLTAQGLDREQDACDVDVTVVPANELDLRHFVLPGTRTDLTTAVKWVEKCERNHVHCREDVSSWYPTRLLHFGPRGRSIKLVLSKQHCPQGSYITLSHRWGSHMKPKLTSTTMTQFKRGIQISDLSHVFRDAVEVCRQFKIYYLWIDALCINQDEDFSDWNIESKIMNKVYSCAFMNISATLSTGADESLFRPRETCLASPAKIEFDTDGNLQDYYVFSSDIWYDEIDSTPLNNRGWVFQERFCARRVLHFGRQQLSWECRELEAMETFPDGIPPIFTVTGFNKSIIYQKLMNLAQSSTNALGIDPTLMWHLLIQSYSKCSLTYPKDKLVAFEGVANFFMARTGGRCITGIWETNIPIDLTWSRHDEYSVTLPRSETSFRAPSWSWASVDGMIRFPTLLGDVRHHFVKDWEILDVDSSESPVLSKHPSLRVQGVPIPLKIKWYAGEMVSFNAAGFHFSLEDTSGADICLDGAKDDLQELDRKSRIFLLALFVTAQHMYGLILAKVRGLGVHRRMGLIEIPLVEGRNAPKTSSKDAKDGNKTRSTVPSREPAEGSATNDRESVGKDVLNLKAIKLMYHLARLKESQIFIC